MFKTKKKLFYLSVNNFVNKFKNKKEKRSWKRERLKLL